MFMVVKWGILSCPLDHDGEVNAESSLVNWYHVDDFVQERRNSIADALELTSFLLLSHRCDIN